MGGLFKGLGAASANGKGKYYSNEGLYLMRVDAVKGKADRTKIPMVVNEATVVKVLETVQDEEPHRVGETLSTVSKQNSDYFLSDVKGMIMGLFNLDPDVQMSDEEWEEVADQLIDEEAQPAAGLPVIVKVFKTTTKQDKEIALVNWIRSPDWAELFDMLDEDERNRFFPNLDWDELKGE